MQANVAVQSLSHVHWQTPVDLAPTYTKGALLAHYGSPLFTAANTVIVPVKTGVTGDFRIEAHAGASGGLLWQAPSDYILPPHDWLPSFGPALTPQGRLYFPGSGGKLFYRDAPDSAQGTVQTVVFFGQSAYLAAKSSYDANVMIDTPLTTDAAGNVYFGFLVTGSTPLALQSGMARISPAGAGTWVSAAAAAGDGSIVGVAMNGAPAVSPDGQTLYLAVNNANAAGYLLALDSTSLKTKGKAALTDPASGAPAQVVDDSSASPTIGPDGTVYYGVLESTIPDHNARGWLLHFNATLGQTLTPGSFGWDDTASLLPASAVPSYTGSSPYLVMTKYNNYGGAGSGNGHNEIAILDPSATESDPISGISVMKEVLTIAGVTPDPTYPGGVYEWCINTAAVDALAGAVFANSEDGYLYRWDLSTNSFSQRIALTSGVPESYTPTTIGPDGQVYAINNAVLFAVGN
ncbi:MAG: hypothetical protein ACREM2_04635 [Vulcanimicrobiaceae bacterium]